MVMATQRKNINKMLTDDELWNKCQTNEPITEEDLGIENKQYQYELNKKIIDKENNYDCG